MSWLKPAANLREQRSLFGSTHSGLNSFRLEFPTALQVDIDASITMSSHPTSGTVDPQQEWQSIDLNNFSEFYMKLPAQEVAVRQVSQECG